MSSRGSLGSTLTWSLQTEDEYPQPDAWLCWRTACGYRVMSQGDNPRYWTALAPNATHVAAGAGDRGLAKCMRYCERHHQSLQTPATAASKAQTQAESNNVLPTTQAQLAL